MKKIEYTLFRTPISRRTYYWLLFLCPLAAFWLYWSSRRTVDSGALAQAEASSSSAG